jgi:hypothetical protein
MRPGDLLAFGGYGLESGIIRLVGRAPISHTAIIWQVGEHGPIMMEAIGEGVRRALVGPRVAGYHGNVWWIPMNEEARALLNIEGMQQFLVAQEGKEFDAAQMLPAAIDSLLHLEGKKDLASFFCSELVTAALQAGGLLARLNPSSTTPHDLVRQGIWGPEYYQLSGAASKRIPGLGMLKAKVKGQ